MTAVEGASGAVSVDGLLAGLPGAVFDSTASRQRSLKLQSRSWAAEPLMQSSPE